MRKVKAKVTVGNKFGAVLDQVGSHHFGVHFGATTLERNKLRLLLRAWSRPGGRHPKDDENEK